MLLKFSFRCLVLRRPALCLLVPVPAPTSCSFAVSEAVLCLQLQPWLQPQSSLWAAGEARHTETHSTSKLLITAMSNDDFVYQEIILRQNEL